VGTRPLGHRVGSGFDSVLRHKKPQVKPGVPIWVGNDWVRVLPEFYPSVVRGACSARPVGLDMARLIGTRIRPGGFSCYRGFRSLALVAFLAFLAWRFSFRLLDAAFLLLLPPLSFFAMGASLRIAWDDCHAPFCHTGTT
jgi:hypothetical protein